MIVNLQREVKSLKEGLGPFPAAVSDSPCQTNLKIVKRQFPFERKQDNQVRRNILPSPLVQEVTGPGMEVEPLIGNTPSCSTNVDYMNRDSRWPADEEERVPLAHGAIAHQPDSTRKIDTIPDSAPTQ